MLTSPLYHQFFVFGLLFLVTDVEATLVPMSFPWTNYTALNIVSGNRGLFVNIANEPMTLRLDTMSNDVHLHNKGDCDSVSGIDHVRCVGLMGTIFDPQTADSSLHVLPKDQWPGNGSYGLDSSHEITAVATANFTGITAFQDFPIVVWSNRGSTNRSAIGMGSSSVFLQSLKDKLVVPSKVWSLFFGSRSQYKPMDGVLHVGGVDESQFTKPWNNFTSSQAYIKSPCALQVLMEDVILTYENGTRHSLFPDPAAVVPACIQPEQSHFTFSKEMLKLFNMYTEYVAPNEMNYTGQVYPKDKRPLMGNLTIILRNNDYEPYETVIPNYEFVSDERGQDSVEGRYVVTNDSNIQVAVGPGNWFDRNGNVVPILGGVFLSQNYLLVQSKTFSLARANLVKSDPKMITVLDSTPDRGDKITRGALAGGLVGAIIFGFVLGAVAIYYGRQWLSSTQTPQTGETVSVRPGTAILDWERQELQGDALRKSIASGESIQRMEPGHVTSSRY
ncbi:hypothetical protein BDD12DRAFT_891013 [Trichophaea hybrida]|nr:hypothetical protein BDD12DRAFT_891013 [Trichophaea hybrida]